MEHVGLESKEFKGKTKLSMSRIVRAKIEEELGKSESKVDYLEEEFGILCQERHRHLRT